MIDCIDCGKVLNDTPGKTYHTICQSCVIDRANQLSPERLLAMAKVGLDAIIDEITEYQESRPKGELKKRYEKYLKEEMAKK